MNQFTYWTKFVARNRVLYVHESLFVSNNCDNVFRILNKVGLKAFSTNSVRFCEKKDNVVTSTQLNEGESQTKQPEQKEEQHVLKADDGGTVSDQANDKPGQILAKSPQPEAETVKSGKESLLDLLGAMKVEVTNKRKLKNMKIKQSFESATQYNSKPEGMESTISMFQKATEEASSQSETLNPGLVAAASAAAATLPNRSQAESELLRQLRQRKALSEAQKRGDMKNIGVIIADMKVGKNSNRQNAWPSDQIRFDDDGRGYTHDRGITSELAGVRKWRNVFQAKRLSIFSPATEKDGVKPALAKPTLWDMDFAHQLCQSTNQMPRNGFEEMIQWTKEGKVWQYPIDNEIGLEEEASVPFHEHIFLNKHLEQGFPRQGPVRHFMELVVAGLARNPYLTVQQKKEHIDWFRDYFHQKEDVLNEADVYLT